MNVLISGGSGLIGSAICDWLFYEKNDVFNYDFKTRPYMNNLDAKNPLQDLLSCDLCNLPQMDAFIDCSWPAKPSDQFKTWNTVVDHFKQQGHGKMILFSSIYGHKTPDFSI